MAPFEGVALVIGAASSDGRAVAQKLVQAGCSRIALADSDEATLDEIVSACRVLGQTDIQLLVRQCNPLVPEDLEVLMAAVVEQFGRIDYCANCLRPPVTAKVKTAEDISGQAYEQAKMDAQAWQRSVWLSMRAEIRCIKSIAPTNQDPSRMSEGSIVNVSAVQGIASEAGFPFFVAAAHGIVGATRATAMDYLKDGIRLNCVCPGPLSSTSAPVQGEVLPMLPHGRIVKSDDVAEAVVFLLGERSAAITGVELPVDSGWSLFHH